MRLFGGARLGRAWRWSWSLGLLVMLALAGCGGDNGNPGTDLGAGPLLAFINSDGNLWLARADGSGAHAVSTTPCPATVNCYGPPTWSPDGKLVAVFGPYKAGNAIFVYNRLGQLQRTLLPVNSLASGPLLWSHDGQTIAYVGYPAPATLTPSSNPGIPQLQFFLLSAHDGTKLGAIPMPVDPNATAQCQDAPHGGPLGSAVDRAINGSYGMRDTLNWSNDGSAILVSSGPCRTQVSLVSRATQQATELLPPNASANVLQATFAPDSQRIAAVQTSPTEDDLLLYDATGGNPKVLVTDTSAPLTFVARLSSPTFAADGQTIYFMRGVDLWSVNIDGSHAQKLVSGNATGTPQTVEAAPLPAPDGKTLAWVELSQTAPDQMPHSALMVGDGQGQHARAIAQDAIWPAWS